MAKGRESRGIVPLDRELHSGSRFEQSRGRPDFDFQWHNVARPQLLNARMAMQGTQRRGAQRVQLPVGSAQPSLGYRIAFVSVVGEEYLPAAGIELPQDRAESSPSEVLTQSFNRMLPITSTARPNRRAKTALSFRPIGRYRTLPSEAAGSGSRLPVFAQRYKTAGCTDEGGQPASLRTSC